MLKLDESKTEQKLRKEIAELGKQLYDRGLVYATAGNISARCGTACLSHRPARCSESLPRI